MIHVPLHPSVPNLTSHPLNPLLIYAKQRFHSTFIQSSVLTNKYISYNVVAATNKRETNSFNQTAIEPGFRKKASKTILKANMKSPKF